MKESSHYDNLTLSQVSFAAKRCSEDVRFAENAVFLRIYLLRANLLLNAQLLGKISAEEAEEEKRSIATQLFNYMQHLGEADVFAAYNIVSHNQQ